jgi:hypothetical protein
MTYAEKLKDPRWQKKRLEILERDKWTCKACGDKERTLHVHHIFYLPHIDPWEIHNGLLITLCEKCHHPKPCVPEYKSCQECPDYLCGEYGCDGPGDHPLEIIDNIGSLLNLIWSHPLSLGKYSDYNDLLLKAMFILQDK